MIDVLDVITLFGIIFWLFGRQILEKKGVKVPKWIDYPVAFIVVLLTTYIIYDTFF